MQGGLQYRSWAVNPAYCSNEKLSDLVSLFFSSLFSLLNPLVNVVELRLPIEGETEQKVIPSYESLGFVSNVLHYYIFCRKILVESAKICDFFPLKKKPFLLTLHRNSCNFLHPSVSLICMSFLTQAHKGWTLHRRALNLSQPMGELGNEVLPFNHEKNMVVGGNAGSLCVALIQHIMERMDSSKPPVVMCSDILFFPHTLVAECLHRSGITVVGYKVDIFSYTADIEALKNEFRKRRSSRRPYVLILSSIIGRRLHNIVDVIREAQAEGIYTVELSVPIMGFHKPIPAQHSPDATIISFKGVTCLDCAIGNFKSADDAAGMGRHLEKATFSKISLGSLWLQMARQTIRFFLSNRYGFGLATQALVLLSHMPGKVYSTRSKLRSSARGSDSSKTPTLMFWKDRRDSLRQADTEQISNLLLFFSRHLENVAVATQFNRFWSFIAKLPSYITVLSVEDSDKNSRSNSTELSITGIIVFCQASAVVTLIKSIGIAAVSLSLLNVWETACHSSSLELSCWRDKVFLFNRNDQSLLEEKLVFIPLNESLSCSQRNRLLETLASAPRSLFEIRKKHAHWSNKNESELRKRQLHPFSAACSKL